MNFIPCIPLPLISSSPRNKPCNLPILHSCNLPLNRENKTKLVVEAEVCHDVSYNIPLLPPSLLANAHHNDSLVWYEASCFYFTISATKQDTINAQPHWDSFWISCCCHVPWRSCSFGYDQSVHALQQFIDGVDAVVDQLKVLDLGMRSI